MKLSQAKLRRRTGFTLVEVLVVIAIIAILVGLLSAGVAKARGKINEVRNRTNISQLAAALEAFKTRYKTYPPSRIKLSETWKYNVAGDPLDAFSVQVLTSMFPRVNTNAPIDWNGNGKIDQPNQGGDFVLEGEECLVFFLGGIPANLPGEPPGCKGFSTNPTNPADHVTRVGAEAIGPFYEFPTNRLVRRQGLAGFSPYFSFLDAYGKSDGDGQALEESKAYAYFSSYNTANGYNKLYGFGGLASDCQALNVWPYAEAITGQGVPTRYHKPNSFQIISAGADHRFGPGTPILRRGPDNLLIASPGTSWTPAQPGPRYLDTGQPGGHDDQSNFYDLLLGAESN